MDNLVHLSCSVKEIAHSIVILFALPECLFNPAIVGNILALGVDPVQVDRLPVDLHTVVRVLVCNNFIFSQFAACRDISSDFMILYFLFRNLWKQLWVYFIMWKRESSFFLGYKCNWRGLSYLNLTSKPILSHANWYISDVFQMKF